MSDRSRVPRALSAAPLCLVLLLLPAAARAQGPDRQVPVPASAPTVLTAADGSALSAFTASSRLCFALQKSGAERPRTVPAFGFLDDDGTEVGGCDDLPVLAPFGGDGRGELHIGDTPVQLMVTGTGVAAVEAKHEGRVVARAATVATGLPGAAGDLRVALLPLVKTPAIDEVALLDAGDVVRTAIAPDPSSLDDPDRALEPARTLTRGSRGGQPWRLGTYRKRVLAPTPLLPERQVTVSCVAVTTGGVSASKCDEPALASVPVVLSPGQACAPLGQYTAVLARAAVRRVVLVLGDGTRRAIPLRAVPGDSSHLRVGVTFVGEGVAIRRLVALGAAGGTLRSGPLRLAPSATPGCGHHDGSGLSSSGAIVEYASVLPALKTPGPHVFHAADSGPDLCLAADRTPHLRGADCVIPPADVAATFLRYAPTAILGATTLYGLVPADVAAVRLRLDDGSTREVPPTPIPGYAGQYAATTLLVDAEVAAPRHIAGYQLRDARGRVLQDQDFGSGALPTLSHVTTVLRAPGLPPLRAGLVTGLGGTAPCLAFGALGTLTDCSAAGPGAFLVRASCAPRRIVIWGLLSHAADDLVLQTADGREIVARKAVLPAALRRGKGTTAALLVLPANVGARRLVLRGKASGHADLVLPPVAAQCGYDTFAWIISGLRAGD
jgi:hypothetical protein